MAKLPTRKRYFDLVGEGHDNPDGSSRQGELLQCEPGEEVTLRPEPDNAYDPNAIAVYTEAGRLHRLPSARGRCSAVERLGRGQAAPGYAALPPAAKPKS
jgi:hypothetical protein